MLYVVMTVVQLITNNDRQKIKKLGIKMPNNDPKPNKRYGKGKSRCGEYYTPPPLSDVCPNGKYRIPENKKRGWFIEVVL